MPDRSLCLIALAAAALTGACASPPGGFDSPVPSERLDAIARAARTRDPGAIPHLIEGLLSDDPLVRMASIRALEDITGQTLGYRHWAPEEDREARVQDWADWYARQQLPVPPGAGSTPSAPATDSSGGHP